MLKKKTILFKSIIHPFIINQINNVVTNIIILVELVNGMV